MSFGLGRNTPTRGRRSCCAAATRDHDPTAAPPSTVMNSRRLIDSTSGSTGEAITSPDAVHRSKIPQPKSLMGYNRTHAVQEKLLMIFQRRLSCVGRIGAHHFLRSVDNPRQPDRESRA